MLCRTKGAWMIDPKVTFAAFESLGEDGEFGIAQRQAGIEPPGLFRFARTPYVSALTAVIESGFTTFAQPGDVCLLAAPSGYFEVYSIGFKISYATAIRWGAQEADIVVQDVIARIALLKRKFLEELAVASKIYVRKGVHDDLPQIAALGKALRRFGPNTLLWVTEADNEHPAGSVEIMSGGIILGRISKIAAGGDVPGSGFSEWAALCERCLEIVQTQKGTP
jgi:hypothetical protein